AASMADAHLPQARDLTYCSPNSVHHNMLCSLTCPGSATCVKKALCYAWTLAIAAGAGPITTPFRGEVRHERLRQGGASGDKEVVLAAQETDVIQGVARLPEHRAGTAGIGQCRWGRRGKLHRTAPSPIYAVRQARRALPRSAGYVTTVRCSCVY